MSSRRQRSIPLVGRYRQVSLQQGKSISEYWPLISRTPYKPNTAPVVMQDNITRSFWVLHKRNKLSYSYLANLLYSNGTLKWICECRVVGISTSSCLVSNRQAGNTLSIYNCNIHWRVRNFVAFLDCTPFFTYVAKVWKHYTREQTGYVAKVWKYDDLATGKGNSHQMS